ncbi:MAG: hypothetical protein HZA01_11685 [Nitrospinae bacterium]|nr:hypothetical protein [Nitrospinota bacterium]
MLKDELKNKFGNIIMQTTQIALEKALPHLKELPLIKQILHKYNEESVIRQFSPELLYRKKIIEVAQYPIGYAIESSLKKNSGSGLYLATTYGEAYKFWNIEKNFIPFEAILLQHEKNGGEVLRVFLIDKHEFTDYNFSLILYRTLKRHSELGFKTKLKPIENSLSEKEKINLAINSILKWKSSFEFTTFTVVNRQYVSFFQMSKTVEAEPLVIKVHDTNVINKCEGIFLQAWNNSYCIHLNDSNKFINDLKSHIEKNDSHLIDEKVEIDINRIRHYSKFFLNHF